MDVGATVGAGRGLDDGDVVVDGEVVADPQATTSSIAARIRAAGEDDRRACRGKTWAGLSHGSAAGPGDPPTMSLS